MMGAFYINKIIHTRLIQDVGVDIEHVGCFFRLTCVIPQECVFRALSLVFTLRWSPSLSVVNKVA